MRQIRFEGEVAFVPLTQGYEAVIDAADATLVAGRNWRAFKSGCTVYAISTDRSGDKKRTLYLHRLLMGDPAGLVDHRDGDGLNNKRRGDAGNLRFASRQQNACNQRIKTQNTSGLKGVSWRKDCAKWQAQIKIDGKNIGLGSFDCKLAAHAAYAKASKDLHGEFGRLK